MRLLSSLLVTSLTTAAAYPIASFFPYGSAAGDFQYDRNDDGGFGPFVFPDPSIIFPVYGLTYHQISISNNGIINFLTPITAFTPQSFPLNIGAAFSPYWADVDTRSTVGVSSNDENLLSIGLYSSISGGGCSGTGCVVCGNGCSVHTATATFKPIPAAISTKLTNLIGTAFPTETPFNPNLVVIATWDRVGYFSQHNDKRNTFQTVIGSDGIRSFVCFFYAQLQWTTGDASGGSGGLGGTSVNAGFNYGDGVRFTSLSTNNVPPPLDPVTGLLANSNAGEPGLYCWSVAATVTAPADVRGDPQFVGFQGQSYQVHGADSTAFALLSAPNAIMNGDFVYLGIAAGKCDYNETVCWSHPGTYISRLGFRVHVDKSESLISLTSGSHAQGMTLQVDDVIISSIDLTINRELSIGNHTVRINKDGSIIVHIHELVRVHVMNSDYFLNIGLQLLRNDWLALGSHAIHSKSPAQDQKIYEKYSALVPLHGLIGQTWRKVTYSNNMPFLGDVMDYALEPSNDEAHPPIFDHRFMYSMYQPRTTTTSNQQRHNN